VPRPRRLATRTGLRSSRLIPDPASASPLRLHVRAPLHSGRPPVTDCSIVRLTTPKAPEPTPARRDSSPRLRACQGRCSARVADSPVHNAPGPRSQGSLGSASCAGGLRCSPRTTRLDPVCGSFAKLTRDPTLTRATNRESLRSPPGTRHARVAGDPAGPPSRRRRWHCGSLSHPGCVVSRVHRPSHVGPASSSRSAVMPPAFLCAHYLPYAQYALLRSESATLSGIPGGGIFDIRWSSALGPAARFEVIQSAARVSQDHCGFAAPQRRF
jgi:hypothetical protein